MIHNSELMVNAVDVNTTRVAWIIIFTIAFVVLMYDYLKKIK